MSVNVVQVDGFYVSSNLPKALFLPAPPSYYNRKRSQLNPNNIRFKRKSFESHKRSAEREKPVAGRKHLSIQTEQYLEELCNVIQEVDAECETDADLDKPAPPLFVPTKTGQDAETQVYPGELFDFDLEVQPVLEDLVAKILEQSIIELIAEDDMAALKALKHGYEMRRNAEFLDIKRIEEEEKVYFKEKQRKLKELEEKIRLENEVAQKIAACIFSQSYLTELVPEVYQKLNAEGYFEADDPETKELVESFWPWVMDEVDSEITTLEATCHLLDTLIEDSIQSIAETTVIRPVDTNEEEPKSTTEKVAENIEDIQDANLNKEK